MQWQEDRNIKKDITFQELRDYLSRIDLLSICMQETLEYENFTCLEEVPDTYDKYYVYGVGMIDSEFYRSEKDFTIYASGKPEDLVFLKCIEVMLSREPKSFCTQLQKLDFFKSFCYNLIIRRGIS